uniref:Leucine rich repeat neuronal 2 n=1 Tax=Salarias fasciatus TaxID=181472 RepID=A0A672IEL2_SALFA
YAHATWFHHSLCVPVVVGSLPPALPWHVSCPVRCVCQIKPWFSPDSVYHEAPTVDCNDLLLTKLPLPIPPDTHTLRLQSNLLSALDTAVLHGLPNLTDLDLSQNRFSHVRTITQSYSIPSLLSLHLEENHLGHLPEDSFSTLPALQELFLSHNNLRSIAPGAFNGLNTLLRLHINNNRLSLRSLVLGGMGLRSLAEDALEGLEDMVHLKELGLNNMEELVSIERAALKNLPELTKLEITNNPRLSYIHPQAFLQLSRLESLMLNSNSLSALHQHIMFSLPSLQEVSLHSNPLRCDCLFHWAAKETLHPHFEKDTQTDGKNSPSIQGQTFTVRTAHTSRVSSCSLSTCSIDCAMFYRNRYQSAIRLRRKCVFGLCNSK